MRFKIIETGEEILAKQRPIVLITSNNEKELPDAFLRRCIFHFTEFPDPPLMRCRATTTSAGDSRAGGRI